MPVTASARFPQSRRWRPMSTGQVATTIIVAQITAPSSGCTM
jgi:hypothetical protein